MVSATERTKNVHETELMALDARRIKTTGGVMRLVIRLVNRKQRKREREEHTFLSALRTLLLGMTMSVGGRTYLADSTSRSAAPEIRERMGSGGVGAKE